ncbi:MAG: ABC transporter ATP-binding protein [Bacteroidetes bacterium]|nr:ABC transporter ATP-binding protein [Bacteroidota bacterium]
MSSSAISIRHLSKKFGAFSAVNDLNLEINAGEVFGFLGPNGAGKSTTLRMLLTLIKPTAGEIFVLGKNLQEHRSEILTQVGSIIEKPDFHLYLTGFNNLKIQARLCGLQPADKQLYELFETVGLKGREHDKVKTYSHGMKQRLGLAQALVHNPQIVILDEPTTGLDPQGIIDLRLLILRLKNEMKKTVVLSSHILSEMELIADSMTIIAGGKAVVQGKVKELLSNEDLIIVIEPQNNILCAQELQQSQWQQRIDVVGESTIAMKLSKHEIPELIKFLADKNLGTYSVSYKRTLEDYFLKLTNQPHV